MPRKYSILFLGILAAFLIGCIKETYDMSKLSDEIRITPTFVNTGVNINIVFNDLVKSNDTIVFDQNNFVKIFSDYKIQISSSFLLKPEINFN